MIKMKHCFIFLFFFSSSMKGTLISDSRIRSIIAKGPKYRFPVHIDFQKCREKNAASLNEYYNRWCKREHVECDALKEIKYLQNYRSTYFLLFS